MKFYVCYTDTTHGDCIVAYDNTPTWTLDNAMLFDSRAEANEWCNSSEANEWAGLKMGGWLTVCELEPLEK